MAPYADNEIICEYLHSLFPDSSTSGSSSIALESLNRISTELARDETFRETVGRSSPQIWERLHNLWEIISTNEYNTVDNDSHGDFTLAVARFTRNLLAGNFHNQEMLFQCEPAIRKLAHTYTSYLFAVDQQAFMTTRFLMQTLSNLVTANENLIQRLWSLYMTLPEEKNILTRMIAHSDDRTVVATLVFISNCLTGNRKRMRALIETPTGQRICISLLDRLAKHVEEHDDKDDSDLFEIGWHVFEMLFDNGFAPLLISATSMDGEVVNPHQTTLLKILDSYLVRRMQHEPQEQEAVENQRPSEDAISEFSTLLYAQFFKLVANARSSIGRSLGTPPIASTAPSSGTGTLDQEPARAAPLQNLDVLLPKVCEAIVLVTQCFCTICLAQTEEGALSQQAMRTRQFLTSSYPPHGDGVVENLIELLRLLDAFLPRIMFGKTSWSTPRPDALPVPIQPDVDGKGFLYLKRDLVRLLGILCYEDKAVQDRVRANDGISVVMNLCVTDERNPYLREHALFALRNLLHENVENQAVVDAIKPMGTWDENGVLRDAPGVRK
ncbi:hypothetical protein M0805_005836 [Coniferiporia weirii]|nr:hypothetical protein M0805_005836 [Coniferiporia weirii]